jgi:hypothetical protein
MPPTPGIRVLNETKDFTWKGRDAIFLFQNPAKETKKKRVCSEVKKNVVM